MKNFNSRLAAFFLASLVLFSSVGSEYGSLVESKKAPSASNISEGVSAEKQLNNRSNEIKQIPIKKRENSQEKINLSKDDSPIELTKDITLDEAEMLSEEQKKEIILTNIAENMDRSTALPEEGDGNKIGELSAEWVTVDSFEDQDPKLLSARWEDATKRIVQMRVNFSLSGQHDYEAGSFSLRIPKYIFKDRDGKNTGVMKLAVPEAPDRSQIFAYIEEDDYYRIINTKRLAAASAGMFEFSVNELQPQDIKDYTTGYKTSAFNAELTIQTHNKNMIGKKSNDLFAQVDTVVRISEADKKANKLYLEWQDNFPKELKPQNPEDYIYVEWKLSAFSNASQPFSINLSDSTSSDGKTGKSIILGYYVTNGNKTIVGKNINDSAAGTFNSEIFNGFIKDGQNFHTLVYTAYPKKDFENGKYYTLKNTCSFHTQAKDDGDLGSITASAEINYIRVPFKEPRGHFIVHKFGAGVREERQGRWRQGIYEGALNDLNEGKDTDIFYRVMPWAFGMPYTYKDGLPKDNPNSYRHNEYSVTVKDEKLKMEDGTELTPGEDYHFKSLFINYIGLYNYEKFQETGEGYAEKYSENGVWKTVEYATVPKGNWAYKLRRDMESDLPDIYVYAKRKDGTFIKCATISHKTKRMVISPENGASVEDKTLVFPEGTVGYKIQSEPTKQSAFYGDLFPTITIHPSNKIKEKVKNIFYNSDKPELKILNYADMESQTKFGKKVINEDYAENLLIGVANGVKLEKTLKYENDLIHKVINLHYSAKVINQTNIVSQDLIEEFIKKGLLTDEKSAIWYDLLPKGVVLKEETIKLREGDSIDEIKTIENYKNSGRTLLIVKATLNPEYKYVSHKDSILQQSGLADMPEISFDATYSWEHYKKTGKTLINNIVYESGNEKLGSVRGLKGEPDNPDYGNNNYSQTGIESAEDYLANLNPDHNNPSFLYAKAKQSLVINTQTLAHLSKSVDVNNEGWYGDGLDENHAKNVYEGGTYNYRIRMQNNENSSSKKIRFFDNLEHYVPGQNSEEYGDQTFRGRFDSIDISDLKRSGIDAKVYYSTRKDLVLDEEQNKAHTNLDDTSVWSQTMPSDKSSIRAIAIDCSKKIGGGEFVLAKGASISAYVKMRAPMVKDLTSDADHSKWYDTKRSEGQSEKGLDGGAHAYNAISMMAIQISKEGVPSDDMLIHNEYTKVGLKPHHIYAKKIWDDDDDRDCIRPESVKAFLYINGVKSDKNILLNANNNWQAHFDDLPYLDENGNKIRYSIKEEVPEGYSMLAKSPELVKDGLLYEFTNKHIPEKISIKGHKTWIGGQETEEISVGLYADGKWIQNKSVMPDRNGKWEYSFDGLNKYRKGSDGKRYEIKYEIKETLVPDDFIDSYEGYNIINRYYPYGDLVLKKEVKTPSKLSNGQEFEFTFRVFDKKGETELTRYEYETSDGRRGVIASGGILKLKADQEVTIKKIHSGYVYELKENVPKGYILTPESSKLSGVIVAGKTVKARAINSYYASGRIFISAKKMIEGKELIDNQFVFDILDQNGKPIITTSNTLDGTIPFGYLSYGMEDVGKTFTYTVKERDLGKKGYKYDKSEKTFTVKVSDNGDGTLNLETKFPKDGLVFKNSYASVGSVDLVAYKKLSNGKPAPAGKFNFELFDNEGNVVANGNNDSRGIIHFSSLKFSQNDIGKTFVYKAKEVIPEDKDYIYDKSECQFTIKVKDKGDGNLDFDVESKDLYIDDIKNDASNPTFVNKPTPGSLTVIKQFDSRDGVDYRAYNGKVFKFKVKFKGEGVDKLGKLTLKRSYYDPNTGKISETMPQNARSANLPSPLAAAETIINFLGSNFNANISDFTEQVSAFNLLSKAKSISSLNVSSLAAKAPVLGQERSYTVKSGRMGVGADKGLGCYYELDSEGNLTISNRDSSSENICQRIEELGIDINSVKKVIIKEGCQFYTYNDSTNTNYFTKGYFENFKNLEEVVVNSKDLFEYTYNLSKFFSGCEKLKKINISNCVMSNIVDMSCMFQDCKALTQLNVENWNTQNVTDMSFMFQHCKALTELNVYNWNISNVKNLIAMFDGCEALSTLNVSNWNTQNAVDISFMFQDCKALTQLNVENWKTNNVKTMEATFLRCEKLTQIKVDKWDSSNVNNMQFMFAQCYSLKELNLSNFKIANMNVNSGQNSGKSIVFCIFQECKSLNKLTIGNSVNTLRDCWLPSPKANQKLPHGITTGLWVRTDGIGKAIWGAAIGKLQANEFRGTWVWQVKGQEYDVTFDKNAQDAHGSMSTLTVKKDEEFTIPHCGFSRLNHRFASWNTQKDGQGVTYIPGQKVRAITSWGSITLYAIWEEENNELSVANGEATFTLAANQAVTFENLPSGLSYDIYEETEAGWVLVRQQNNNGEISSNANSRARFTNSYKPGVTSQIFGGIKLKDGKAAPNYMFKLEEVTKSGIEKTIGYASSTESGNFNFNPITYKEPGKYKYKISEVNNGIRGIKYDNTIYEVECEVYQDSDGNLKTRVNKTPEEIVFRNTTKTGSMKIVKKLNGLESSDKEFKAQVSFDDGRVENVTLKAGQEAIIKNIPLGSKYSVTEIEIPKGYKLEEINNEKGEIKSEKMVEVVITNRYDVIGSIPIKFSKKMIGKDLEGGDFQFGIIDEKNNFVAQASNDIHGNIDFGAIPVKSVGTFKWLVAEIPGYDPNITYDQNIKEIIITSKDLGNGQLEVSAKYPEDTTFVNKNENNFDQKYLREFKIHKTVKNFDSGVQLSEAAKNKEFNIKVSMKIMNWQTNEWQELSGQYHFSSNRQKDGLIKNGSIIKIKHDETITVKGVPRGVKISVSEEASPGYKLGEDSILDGQLMDQELTLNLVNIYDAKGSFKPSGEKGLIGRNINGYRFNFKLLENGKVIQNVTNNDDGKILFEEIQYSLKDIGKEHVYTILEEKGRNPKVIYDKREYTIKVMVSDDGNGKIIATGDIPNLNFTNRYRHELPSTGKKTLIFAAISGISLLCLTIYLLISRRKLREVRKNE